MRKKSDESTNQGSDVLGEECVHPPDRWRLCPPQELVEQQKVEIALVHVEIGSDWTAAIADVLYREEKGGHNNIVHNDVCSMDSGNIWKSASSGCHTDENIPRVLGTLVKRISWNGEREIKSYALGDTVLAVSGEMIGSNGLWPMHNDEECGDDHQNKTRQVTSVLVKT